MKIISLTRSNLEKVISRNRGVGLSALIIRFLLIVVIPFTLISINVGVATAGTQCNDGIDNDGDGLIDWGYTHLNDPHCASPFEDSEESGFESDIPWGRMPVFQMPEQFDIIYGANAFQISNQEPLQHGFTHIDIASMPLEVRDDLPIEKRAILWTNVGGMWDGWRETNNIPFQPWNKKDIWSPWENDLDAYRTWWEWHLHEWYGGNYHGHDGLFNWTRGTEMPEVDLLFLDIEQMFMSDEAILGIKNDPIIPASIRNLPDVEFIDLYKRSMAFLYGSALEYPKGIRDYAGRLSSYHDSLLLKYNLWDIDDRTWEEWTTDRSVLNYIHFNYTRDINDPRFYEEMGPFYDNLEILAPSAGYFWSDYPSTREQDSRMWAVAAHHIPRLLFGIEANKAWDRNLGGNRPLIMFCWFLYHNAGPDRFRAIRPHMAHAESILTFMAGADGIYIWEGSLKVRSSIPNYEAFVYGLYRLSQYSEFFSGNYEIYIHQNAREIYNRVGQPPLPIWRGVINEVRDEMLVAAYNSYAEPQETTEIPIFHNDTLLDQITVHGQNTWLGVCQLPSGPCEMSNQIPLVNAGEDQVIAFPESSVTLTGRVSDDGLPNPPGALTILWSQVSGPVNAVIQNPDLVTTHVMGLTQVGVYAFQLMVDDGDRSTTDEVQVTVKEPPGGDNPIDGPQETRFNTCREQRDLRNSQNISVCYQLAEPGHVKLTLYDKYGREIGVLKDGQESKGIYQILWDGKNDSGESVASGVYLVILKLNDQERKTKVVVIR